MLIHVCPRFFTGDQHVSVQLVDVTIDALGITLGDGEDLVMRQPYPNKRFYVACRKVGRKAIDGLLLDTGTTRVKEFEVVTRWAVFAEAVVTHRVQHVVLDDEYDAVSTNMIFWHATSKSLGNWESRMPTLPDGATPANHMPRMSIMPKDRADRVGNVIDVVNTSGMVTARREVFSMPTVQPERLQNLRLDDRVPHVDDAFKVIVPTAPIANMARVVGPH